MIALGQHKSLQQTLSQALNTTEGGRGGGGGGGVGVWARDCSFQWFDLTFDRADFGCWLTFDHAYIARPKLHHSALQPDC